MIEMLSSLLQGELLGVWPLALGVVAAVVSALVLLVNTDLLLTKPVPCSLQQLESADLDTTTGDGRSLKAGSLWKENGAVVLVVRRPGCSLCRQEAAELSSLQPQLEELGVPLVAVVKESLDTEIQDFRPHFSGQIFVDQKQCFYGPQQRRMGLALGLARLGVLQNLLGAQKKGFHGNKKGEGFILGGLYVIGAGEQGILLEHREKEFGNKAHLSSILEVAKRIQKSR